MSKKITIITISSITIIVLVVAGWWVWQSRAIRPMIFTHNQGISFSYPETLVTQTLSEQDKKDHFLFRAVQSQNVPQMLITLRYEDGIKTIASISKQEPIDLLVNNTRQAYPKRFPGYKEISQRLFDIKGHKAAEFIFTYQNKGETVKQQFWIIIKDDNTAFYVAFQSKESDFDKLSKEYLTPITSSLTIN